MPANLPIKMAFREAILQDIPQIQIVRHAVNRKAGWVETGIHGRCEIKFEMLSAEWLAIRGKNNGFADVQRNNTDH
jgi:hypothetical protein